MKTKFNYKKFKERLQLENMDLDYPNECIHTSWKKLRKILMEVLKDDNRKEA